MTDQRRFGRLQTQSLAALLIAYLPLACSDDDAKLQQSPAAAASEESTGSIDGGTDPISGSGDNASPETTGRTQCKRGGAYGYHSVADLSAFSKGSSWWYNWSLSPDKDVAADYKALGMEFVPMVWNGNFTVADAVAKIPDDSRYLLAFNEPNFKSQANLSPAQAAARWPDIQAIAKQKNLKIISPAVNYCGPAANCHETDPFVYLDKFFAACKDCQVDFIAVHWYACKREYLVNYLNGFKKYNKQLWVTEFSCGDGNATEKSLAGQKAYLDEAVQELESNPLVFRYSWFSSRTTAIPNVNLLGNSGVLAELGSKYNSAASNPIDACHQP